MSRPAQTRLRRLEDHLDVSGRRTIDLVAACQRAAERVARETGLTVDEVRRAAAAIGDDATAYAERDGTDLRTATFAVLAEQGFTVAEIMAEVHRLTADDDARSIA